MLVLLAKERDNIIEEYGHQFGACLTRDIFNNITARKMNWFYDNGAFSDWKRDKAFNREKYIDELFKIEAHTRYGENV